MAISYSTVDYKDDIQYVITVIQYNIILIWVLNMLKLVNRLTRSSNLFHSYGAPINKRTLKKCQYNFD